MMPMETARIETDRFWESALELLSADQKEMGSFRLLTIPGNAGGLAGAQVHDRRACVFRRAA
jgi:hypothetical protein